MTLQPGTQLREWTLERELGRGAEGVVWAAATAEGKRAALKIGGLKSPIFYELTTIRRVGAHPNVCALAGGEGVDNEAKLKWFPMEMMDAPLSHLRGADADIGAVARAMIRALRQVHAAGFVFRDVSPNNILTRGAGAATEYKLSDFGCARETAFPGMARFEGTPDYVAVGVIEGGMAPQHDLESLAYVLFWLGGGALPWAGQKIPARATKRQLAMYATERRHMSPQLEAAMDPAVRGLLRASRGDQSDQIDYDALLGLWGDNI